MSSDDRDGRNSDSDGAFELLIGTPERQRALEALETHMTARRLNTSEYERRAEACDRARTQSELLRIFADLPAPHPQLPPPVVQAVNPADSDSAPPMPPTVLAGCLTLGLGLPVAIVLGYVYESWWVLAVPVAVPVVMAYVEQLRARPIRRGPESDPPTSQ
ncbi:DUF1707 SHOCT-like domain-containing protein [Actinoplanes teichomyceticus]|uniref:Uncharacterized protein DUF1707 n=1 Tax=Actinoplanes teichomyceticus TaxID=1867 RepID=A0A561VMQ4_ACTTI|nr:DUF1707 domain-containing protein [Actinoplanes teichomyceticus]TWG12888.1 uncharacterized protein DUF1707 [Actinoplanes teichomyceticus]GIF13639.1 hypothetical protein Ate01nite_36710 [Actinoplanes teichomyceticus]